MRPLLAATALSLIHLITPSWAQQGDTPVAAPGPLEAEVPEQGAALSADSIILTSAQQLAGRTVVDAQVEDVGTVEYLLVGLPSGKIQYVMVDPGPWWNLNDDLIPIPWGAINTGPGMDLDSIGLRVAARDLSNAPSIPDDRLETLTEPTTIRRMVEYYAPLTGAAPQPEGADEPMVLMGRQVTSLLVPPTLAKSENIRDAEVELPGGEDIGEVETLMIDVAHGQVAYVLLEREKFLFDDIIPVPMQALRWAPDEDELQLAIGAEQLAEIPRLAPDDDALPAAVPPQELAVLYGRFGLTPYWEQFAAQPQTGQPEGNPEE